MKKVYCVSAGSWDEYAIYSIHSHKAGALQAADRLRDGRIEEWTMDEKQLLNPVWEINFDPSGEVSYAEARGGLKLLPLREVRWSSSDRSPTILPGIVVYVRAKTKAQAIEVAEEKRYRYLKRVELL